MGTDTDGQGLTGTPEPEEIITADDHDAGFKDVPVEYRSGKTGVIRLTALNHRAASKALMAFAAEPDPYPVLYASLPRQEHSAPDGCAVSPHPGPLPQGEGEEAAALLDRLTPMTVNRLVNTAWALAFGDLFQKKMAQAGVAAFRTMTGKTAAEPS